MDPSFRKPDFEGKEIEKAKTSEKYGAIGVGVVLIDWRESHVFIPGNKRQEYSGQVRGDTKHDRGGKMHAQEEGRGPKERVSLEHRKGRPFPWDRREIKQRSRCKQVYRAFRQFSLRS